MNIQQLFDNTRAWGVVKGITGPDGKGTLLKQLSKSQEELTEARDAAVEYLIAMDYADIKGSIKARHKLMDEIGDIIVTAIIAADMVDLTGEECLEYAYNKIKGRSGAMVGGSFVKEVEA